MTEKQDVILPTGFEGYSGDRFYAALLAAHEGLTEAESHALNAKLVLLFAAEIGDVVRLEGLLSSATG